MSNLVGNPEDKFSHDAAHIRKPVFGVSRLGPHKQGCTITEDDKMLEISDLGIRDVVLSM